jgi:predicted GTPase
MRDTRTQYEDADRTANEIAARSGGVPELATNAEQLGGVVAANYQQVLARNAKLADLGIWAGSSPPASPITYAAWLSGTTGYWGWIQTP